MNKPVEAEDYPIIITRDGDGHVMRINELFLVERDAELCAGLERLKQRVDDLIAEQKALGTADTLPLPGGVVEVDRESHKLKIFAFKSAIVAMVLVIFVAAAAASFTYAMREPLRHTGLKLGRSAIKQVERGLRDAANKELTAERRERLRIRVAEARPFLEPFVTELRPLFVGFCSPYNKTKSD